MIIKIERGYTKFFEGENVTVGELKNDGFCEVIIEKKLFKQVSFSINSGTYISIINNTGNVCWNWCVPKIGDRK